MRILVINPGSTSTKVALFENNLEKESAKIEHSVTDLAGYSSINEQFEYRLQLIKDFLVSRDILFESLTAVVGRGGLPRPIPCGTYKINETLLSDLWNGVEGIHASNLGAPLAKAIAEITNIPSFIVDPITVDEMDLVAKITGFPDVHRESRLHTLNHKAVGRKIAKELGNLYEEMNFIICHMGSGSSVAAHKKGKVIDMCDARGEGPMSTERCGGINTYLFLRKMQTGAYSFEEMEKKIYTQTGVVAHLGTKDIREVEQRILDGDEYAKLIWDALIYQHAKEIGAQAAAMSGEVDAIVLTGGMAYNSTLTDALKKKISFIAPVFISPGEEEMEALALGALRVLLGEEEARNYDQFVNSVKKEVN